jgi:hypothetical protein
MAGKGFSSWTVRSLQLASVALRFYLQRLLIQRLYLKISLRVKFGGIDFREDMYVTLFALKRHVAYLALT